MNDEENLGDYMNFLSVLIYDNSEATTTIIYDTNPIYALGINDLDLGSLGTWDVEFRWGTFDDIFGTSFDFDVRSDAQAANNAIAALFNSDSGVISVKDANNGTLSSAYQIPYNFATSTLVAVEYGPYTGDSWQPDIDVNFRNKTIALMWAKATAVPIPGAFWLLGSGLIGIVGIRKKFKK